MAVGLILRAQFRRPRLIVTANSRPCLVYGAAPGFPITEQKRTFPRRIAGLIRDQPVSRPDEMTFFYNVQNVLSVFSVPAVEITLLRVRRQIDKTALAALQTGKRLLHNSYLLLLSLSRYDRKICGVGKLLSIHRGDSGLRLFT